MNKKGVQMAVVVSIIVAVVGAAALLLFIISMAGPMAEVMGDSVCSFSVFFRQLVLGNPLAKIGQQLTSGISIIPVDIPLPCSTSNTNLGSSEKPVNSTEFIKLIADQAKRCWSLFGSGSWDSLLWSAKGQKFLCFDDEVYVRFATGEEVNRVDMRRFMITESVEELGGTSRTYAQLLPDETLDVWRLGYSSVDGVTMCPGAENCLEIEGNKICKSGTKANFRTICDNSNDCGLNDDGTGGECFPRRYRLFVYFIDYITPAALQYVNMNSLSIDTVCYTYGRDALGGDLIHVCIQEVEQ